jgi:hypothetical protein
VKTPAKRSVTVNETTIEPEPAPEPEPEGDEDEGGDEPAE